MGVTGGEFTLRSVDDDDVECASLVLLVLLEFDGVGELGAGEQELTACCCSCWLELFELSSVPAKASIVKGKGLICVHSTCLLCCCCCCDSLLLLLLLLDLRAFCSACCWFKWSPVVVVVGFCRLIGDERHKRQLVQVCVCYI